MEEQLSIKEAAKKQALIDELEHAVSASLLLLLSLSECTVGCGGSGSLHTALQPGMPASGGSRSADAGVGCVFALVALLPLLFFSHCGVCCIPSQAALQQHVQLTQYVEADHKAARREYLKHLMEQNKKVQLAPSRTTLLVRLHGVAPGRLSRCAVGWPLAAVCDHDAPRRSTLPSPSLSLSLCRPPCASACLPLSRQPQLITYREHVKTVEKKKEIEADVARPDYHEVTWNRSTR